MSELASQSLDLVNRELSSTLDSARSEIEDFIDGHSDSEGLLRAASMLHLASGALKIVEIPGAALLAEEMEQTCRALTEVDDTALLDEGIEALTRAMVQLPAYLDRLLSGGNDVALVLLPLLNDLRNVRSKPQISEGTLLLLNAGPFEQLKKTDAGDAEPLPTFSGELQAVAQKLRPSFQTALLGFIRGEDQEQNLKELTEASETLQRVAEAEPVKQLWSVLAGVLVALSGDGLEPTIALKRLLGQADRELKRLIESGEAVFVGTPPVDLLNSLLYYIARAQSDDPRLLQLRETYGLQDFIPGADKIAQAREDLSGPSVKLMQTVAQAIKEDLSAVKDVLDIFVRTGMRDVLELKPQLDMLKKIGDTLGVLGLETARNQIQAEARQLTVIVAKNQVSDPQALERIAATLLEVEDALDRELVRAVAPGDGAAIGEVDETTQYRHVTQAVMGECIVNLARIKDAVIKIVEDPTSVRALDQVKPQLRGITAGLLMLNKTKAVKIVERIGAVITIRLAPDAVPLKQRHLERLADAIVSVEYFMETVSAGRSDPVYMLENAERCLNLLERAPSEAEPDQKAAAQQAPAPAKAPASPPSVMEVAEDRSEPELLEIFIEEAKEEIVEIRRYLPVWLDNQENSEALISVRRSFHTLKGSGRMVGAQLLGEFAWSVENLLNRVINQTLAPSPAMLEFVGEAAAVLPGLVEQLEIGVAPKVDLQLMMKRAEAFAEADPDAEGLTSESLRAQALVEEEAPSTRMDPVLMEIFVKEIRSHLATINGFIEANAGANPPHIVDEPLYRASHTLLGSAKMAASPAGIELAQPLNQHLGLQFESGPGLSPEGLVALGEIAAEIERMATALEADQDFVPDAAILVKFDLLAPPPSAAAPPADAGQPVAQPEEKIAEVVNYDPEIAGIFAEEATELLDQADTALQDLGNSDDRSNQFRELQRLLHTLKGGARMAGVLVMGDLSHALETLVSGMATGVAATDEKTTGALQESLDRLHQMRDAIDVRHIVRPADELIDRVDTLARGEDDAARSDAPGEDAVDVGDAGILMADVTGFFEAELGSEFASGAAQDGETTGDGAAANAPTADAAALEAEAATDAASQDTAEAEVEPGDEPIAAAEVDVGSAAGSEAEPEPIAATEGEAETEPEAEAEPEAKVEPELSTEAEAEVSTETGATTEADAPVEAEAPVEVEAPAEAEAPVEVEAGELVESVADAAPAEPTEAEPEPVVPELPAVAAAARNVERADTARVDAGLLDLLLNNAGEISIFQSRLNQQVHSIDFHLGELGQTVTRLREQLRNLETETEAQILHRHQEDGVRDEDFDPLELDRYSTIQQLSRALAETSNDVASINDLLAGLASEADTLLTQQSRVTTELQDGLMQTRMVSFQHHVPRLSRIVRQAAQETGKSAECVVVGAESQLDRQVLENILPALEHLLRNAVVHGVESTEQRTAAGKPAAGVVSLNLRREGSEVLIEVSDDGAGLNLEAIKRKAVEQGLASEGQELSEDEAVELILRPGFSTAGELTQSAGRGVGMDVVDNEIKKLGGSLRIATSATEGTQFLVRLPYTLAITHALIVNLGEETFALPLPTVEGITRVRREQLHEILLQDDPRLNYGDVSYRVQHLGVLVGAAPSPLPEDESAVSLVLVRAGENSTALLTDSLEGSREIIVKTLGPHLVSVPGVSGATILGDGRVIVILDAGTLVRSQAGGAVMVAPPAPVVEPQLGALVVDDSITMRRVTERLLERRGVRVLTARDGLDAIEALREHEVDIILLDIEMPRMDGYQFATHVRNDPRLKDVPIIMVTSRSGEKHRAKAIEIGVNDYLSKPYQESQLVAAVEALLGRSL